MTSGKWYWENTITVGSSVLVGIGTSQYSTAGHPGWDAFSWAYSGSGQKFTANSGSTYGASYTTNDVIGVAFDADAGTLTFYKNGTSQGVAFSSLTSGPYFPVAGVISTTTVAANFGQRPFAYTAPSGFKALCTQNLPTPAIGASSSTLANKNFDIATYTGTGAIQSITNSGAFQPDFVWLKVRNQAYGHALFDSIRGSGNGLQSNSTNAEVAWGSSTLSSFNSNGFSLGADTTYLIANSSANTFVGWQWKGGGTGVSNTSGTITSTVSANPTAGISVVSFSTVTSGTSSTIGHGLGAVPKMIILKYRNQASNWTVHHASLGTGYVLRLNTTDAQITNTTNINAVSSTTFTLGSSWVDNPTQPIIAYCFAEVAGFSKFGSYTGNGTQGAGPFVYTGFRPRYVVVKKTSSSGTNWHAYDTSRSTYNYSGSNILKPDDSAAELTARNDVQIDILSNGFRLIGNDIGINENNGTFIYMAFAEAPFNYARAR
jgi:hypothetical protein